MKTACFYVFPSIWQTNMRCRKQYPDLILQVLCAKMTSQVAKNGGQRAFCHYLLEYFCKLCRIRLLIILSRIRELEKFIFTL